MVNPPYGERIEVAGKAKNRVRHEAATTPPARPGERRGAATT